VSGNIWDGELPQQFCFVTELPCQRISVSANFETKRTITEPAVTVVGSKGIIHKSH